MFVHWQGMSDTYDLVEVFWWVLDFLLHDRLNNRLVYKLAVLVDGADTCGGVETANDYIHIAVSLLIEVLVGYVGFFFLP